MELIGDRECVGRWTPSPPPPLHLPTHFHILPLPPPPDTTGYAAIASYFSEDPFLLVYSRRVNMNWSQKGYHEIKNVVAIAIHVLNDSVSMLYYISEEDKVRFISDLS